MDTIEGKVRELLCEIFERPDADDIADSDDLQEFGMDSLNCIELIVKLEDSFQIEISDEQLDIQYVDTIEHICVLIRNYV